MQEWLHNLKACCFGSKRIKIEKKTMQFVSYVCCIKVDA